MQDSGFKKKDTSKNNFPQDQLSYTRGGEPKIMKKVVNSVLASALALTVAPMVVGAEEAATTTAPQIDPALDKVVKRLAALGLVEGMGNGDYAVDKNVTRAQFATLVVRARGLASGVALAQNEQRFADVKSADWFSGWVNVAAGQELIKGYPNNTFGANNNVTYAEAVAMIVRALGYDVTVKGVWPNNYIAKAAELGISKGVKIDPNKPATRGDIFMMLDNSLNIDLMKQDEYGSGDVGYHKADGENLLTEYLNVEVVDMDWLNDDSDNELPFVSNVPVTGLGTLKANEVTFLGGKETKGIKGTYKVADGINANEFGGQHVQVWVKDDREDVVVWMENSEDEEVINDTLDTFYYNNKVIKLDKELDGMNTLSNFEVKLGNEKTYGFAKDFKITYNYKRYADQWDKAFKAIGISDESIDAYKVKIVLNDDGDIAYMSVVDDRSADNGKAADLKYGSEVIKSINLDKQKIEVLHGDDVDLKGDEEGKDFIVFRNGLPAKLADLKEMDVFSMYYADGDKDHKIIVANATVVEGKVDDVIYRKNNGVGNYFLKIGDKNYRLRATTFSDDKNKTIEKWGNEETDKFEDLDGLNVKIYLDTTGRVRHIETTSTIKERRVTAVLAKDIFYDEGKDQYSVSVFNEKDSKATLEVKDAEDFAGEFQGKDLEDNHDAIIAAFKVAKGKPVVVEYELDADGDVKEVELVDSSDLVKISAANWDKAADEDDNVIEIDGDSYDVAEDAVVFDMTGAVEKAGNRNEYKDLDVAKFKDIAEDDYEVLVHTKNGEVDYMYVISGDKSIASQGEFGVVDTFSTRGGDDYVNVVTKDGSVKNFKLDGTVGTKFGRFDTIRYEVNSDNEIIVKDTVRVVNSKEDTTEEVEINKALNNSDDIDSITTALVDDVDGRDITMKTKDGKGELHYFTTSSTVYFNQPDLGTNSGVSEGDYVVLIDTDDDGKAIDYVVYITDEDTVEDWNYDMTNFLSQNDKWGQGGGENPDDLELSGLAAEEKVVFAALSRYTITGTVSNEEAEITVDGEDVDNLTVTMDGDTFKAVFTGKPGQETFEVTATAGEDTVTEEVTVK
ncbi:S-layer homology domain-containing protein [Brevibacillus sp. SYSU BS000544]|uniref:S-layer homology domain-containing protein n=1 Tax=Brevibacillus sp. SYSU BS000544 TaxID=3416443 RepID=UPI003CE4B496